MVFGSVPYRILNKLCLIQTEITLSLTDLTCNVSLLRPVVHEPLDEGVVTPSHPAAVEVVGAPAYSVRQHLDSRWRRGQVE